MGPTLTVLLIAAVLSPCPVVIKIYAMLPSLCAPLFFMASESMVPIRDSRAYVSHLDTEIGNLLESSVRAHCATRATGLPPL